MSGARHVVVAAGHMTDAPGRAVERFPESAAPHVGRIVRSVLEEWRVGPGWLMLCGAARGADLLAAEHALDCGADVELHIAPPLETFVAESVGRSWLDRFDAVRRASTTHLVDAGRGDRYVRTNESLVARLGEVAPDGPTRAIVVWDGRSGDGPGGTADLVAALDALVGGRGVLRIIHPRPTDRQSSMGGIAS